LFRPPAWVKELLDAWLTAAGIQSGPVFRPVSKADVVAGKALTENSIWWIVREYAGNLDLGKIARPARLEPERPHLGGESRRGWSSL
jgi:hypothetical protein